MAGVFYSQFHIHETAFTEILTSHIALHSINNNVLYRTPEPLFANVSVKHDSENNSSIKRPLHLQQM